MDPALLATTVTSLLAPYLAKAGGAILDRAAAGAPDAAAHLWEAVTKHFEGKPAGAAVAADLAQKPTDQDQQELFAAQLKVALKNDPEFAAAIQELAKKAGASEGSTNITITTGDISGNTGSSIAIGTNANAKNG